MFQQRSAILEEYKQQHINLDGTMPQMLLLYTYNSTLIVIIYNFNILCILTLRLLMSYIYGAPILDVSRSHTTTQHSR